MFREFVFVFVFGLVCSCYFVCVCGHLIVFHSFVFRTHSQHTYCNFKGIVLFVMFIVIIDCSVPHTFDGGGFAGGGGGCDGNGGSVGGSGDVVGLFVAIVAPSMTVIVIVVVVIVAEC